MKGKLTIIFSLVLFMFFGWVGVASAHISNENEIYNDLEDSPAKVEITKLRALDIIGAVEGEESFEPKSELDKETLGFWLAKAADLEGHTDDPTPNEYALEAVEFAFLNDIEGNATYADVTAGILKIIGVDEVEEPAEQAEELGILAGEWHDLVDAGGIATKENAALLFDMALNKKGPSGESIIDILGIKEGPTGIVDDVKEEVTIVDGEEQESYTLTMDGGEIPFYSEGKIALFDNIMAAKGKAVTKSYVKTIEEGGNPPLEMLIYIQEEGSSETADEEEVSTEQIPDDEVIDDASTPEEANAESADAEQSGISLGTVWTVVIVLLIVVGIGIYISGRKKS